MLVSCSRHRWILPWLIAALPIVVAFGPAMSPSRGFAFRDAAHYYPPLLEVVRSQWPNELPLWNPGEERGRPLLADPTAAVLYPGQLIFALPLTFLAAFKLYVVAHVALGFVSSYFAARRLGMSCAAAALAGVSYACGGAIIFQYCNLPYLIGAAWLPWGIVSAFDVVQGRSRGAAIELSTVLTLLVLGGDPQAAYLLGILSVIAAVSAHGPRCSGSESSFPGGVRQVGGQLLFAGALAMGLSAAQWIPTYEWASMSARTGQRARDPATGQPEQTRSETKKSNHDRQRYDFSIAPWRWCELLWPNVSGRLFPRHERWIRAIPAEGRAWTPSLYFGLLPLMLACRAWRLRGGRWEDRALTWLALFGVFGSLGRFGVGWIVAEIVGSTDLPHGAWDDEVGGVYWALVRVLPGFHLFRYPAKLWTWTAVALSLLAARGLDDATRQPRQRRMLSQWLSAYVVVSAGLFLLILFGQPYVDHWWSTVTPDRLFGPLAISAARQHLLGSLAHGVIVAGLARRLTRRRRLLPANTAPRVARSLVCATKSWRWWAVVLTAGELALASRSMMTTAPLIALDQQIGMPPSPVGSARSDRPLVYRVPPLDWYPREWSQQSSVDRLEACVAWDRWTARPKYPMTAGVDSLRGSTSFSSRDHLALMAVLDELQRTRSPEFLPLLEQLGVDFICGPSSLTFPGLRPEPTTPPWPGQLGARWWRVPNTSPRAWIVHTASVVAVEKAASADDLMERTREILLPNGQPRDLREHVVFESARDAVPADEKLTAPTDFGDRGVETCRLQRHDGSRVIVETRLQSAGWLVLNETFAPGWTARVRSNSRIDTVSVRRANRVMRAVALPPGRHRVTFQYDPPSVHWGFWISGASLGLMMIWLARTITYPARFQRDRPRGQIR